MVENEAVLSMMISMIDKMNDLKGTHLPEKANEVINECVGIVKEKMMEVVDDI